MSCDVGEVIERLENELCYDYNYELCSFSNPSIVSSTSQFILQSFFQLILQPLSLHLHHESFSNPSVTLPTSQLILQPFHCFTHITVHSPILLLAHSPTFLSLHLRHNPFSNPSIALPTSKLILQPFFRFSYVTGSVIRLLNVLHIFGLLTCGMGTSMLYSAQTVRFRTGVPC